MKQLTQAMVLLCVLCVLPALTGVASAGPASRTVPVLQAQDATGRQEDLSPARRYYLKGVELMTNSRFLDAVEQFQLCIDEDGESIDCHRRLGLAYTQMGATEADYYLDALDVYEDLKGLLPEGDVDVRKSIAFVQAAMGDIDDAVATYHDILGTNPDQCEIWNQIGAAEKLLADRTKKNSAEGAEDPAYLERVENAILAYTKVTELCPDSMQAFTELGSLEFGLGRHENAAKVYEDLLARNPENIDALTRLAYIFNKSGNWAKAGPVYQHILEIDSTRVSARQGHATALQKLGKFTEAAAELQAIIRMDPAKYGALYCSLANLYALDAKDGEMAIETAMRGISVNAPVQPCLTYFWGKGLELRGFGFVTEGKYDRGIAAYREAKIKFSQILGDSRFGGNAQKQIGRLDQLITIAEQTREKSRQGGE